MIYQGTLAGAGLFGRPDFLVRADVLAAPDGEPRPGGRHYEIVDAKLARTAKARAVLQTAFYSRLLAELQGTEPRWMHLALGNGEFVPFKVKDFAAYERQTRRRLEEVLGAGPPAGLYPEPVEHCAICRWSELCAGRRRVDDDLSLVAGMTTGQRRALKEAGIAEQILALVAQGRTAGITGPSHAVIHHLIDTVCAHASQRGLAPRIGQRADRDNPYLHDSATGMSSEQLDRALRDGELDVAAGTAWLWARPGLAASVDTLFVDEAGQLSLANVLAVAGAARNLVLLGDPQQLAQPSQATHPPGAGASALGHILGERATMPEGAGLLLDRTYRMHPDLCRYTSEVFYDGKLHGVDGLGRQEILGTGPFSGSGLRVVEVPHEGNTNASPEEAGEVARLGELLAGCSWRDRDGAVRPVGRDGILIVTPYNAQIRAIQDALAARGLTGFRVGTVDKFQGREAPVVIYSMATSSADEAPRGLEFLYDRHRLNVATSRARAMAIIVASPDLIRVSCRTPHQMTLVNALCRAWEEPS